MHTDIIDLREFYLSPLGQTARRLLRLRLGQIWPSVRGETVLALGYGTPLLRPWLEQAGALAALMPATQGVAYWPREGPNVSSLVTSSNLPLRDESVDRVVLFHALEGAPEPGLMLREVWRVMKSGGRMLVIVPNRRGFWAHSDGTPFGHGQPYSSFQLKDTLRTHGFLADRHWRALYAFPSQIRLALSLADFCEKYGEKLFPALGGLHIVEAGKQLYAPLLTKTQTTSHRLVLPLPLPSAQQPLPAG